MLSAAKKRYLFIIYELGQTGKPIRSKDIASSLKLKPPSVSKMLNALSEDDLIEKEFYGTVTFTPIQCSHGKSALYGLFDTVCLFIKLWRFGVSRPKGRYLCLCDLSSPAGRKLLP